MNSYTQKVMLTIGVTFNSSGTIPRYKPLKPSPFKTLYVSVETLYLAGFDKVSFCLTLLLLLLLLLMLPLFVSWILRLISESEFIWLLELELTLASLREYKNPATCILRLMLSAGNIIKEEVIPLIAPQSMLPYALSFPAEGSLKTL